MADKEGIQHKEQWTRDAEKLAEMIKKLCTGSCSETIANYTNLKIIGSVTFCIKLKTCFSSFLWIQLWVCEYLHEIYEYTETIQPEIAKF